MSFDVPKLVRSPGCDHGHNEESRNGREVKIHILESYIRTSEWFQVIMVFFRSTEGLSEPPGGSVGPIGPYWRRGERSRERGAPPCPNRIGLGEGAAPLFPSPSLSLPLFPLRRKEGGGGPNPTWTRCPSRTPPLARPLGPATSSSLPLYTGSGVIRLQRIYNF